MHHTLHYSISLSVEFSNGPHIYCVHQSLAFFAIHLQFWFTLVFLCFFTIILCHVLECAIFYLVFSSVLFQKSWCPYVLDNITIDHVYYSHWSCFILCSSSLIVTMYIQTASLLDQSWKINFIFLFLTGVLSINTKPGFKKNLWTTKISIGDMITCHIWVKKNLTSEFFFTHHCLFSNLFTRALIISCLRQYMLSLSYPLSYEFYVIWVCVLLLRFSFKCTK